MASITKDVLIEARPDEVWSALRDFGALHERLAPGFVVDTQLDGDDQRVITFFNGAVARELLVSVDDVARRLVYSVLDSPLRSTHDNSAAQVIADGRARTRFVWTKDVLPDEIAPQISQLMDRGIAVIKQTMESGADGRQEQQR
jgi:Polyketide cyclase / dehydrase and lipid transport